MQIVPSRHHFKESRTIRYTQLIASVDVELINCHIIGDFRALQNKILYLFAPKYLFCVQNYIYLSIYFKINHEICFRKLYFFCTISKETIMFFLSDTISCPV